MESRESGKAIEDKRMNWVAFPVPEGCRGIAVSFDKDTALEQINRHGARPLFGFDEYDSRTEEQLPVSVYVTDGGDLIPDRKYLVIPGLFVSR